MPVIEYPVHENYTGWGIKAALRDLVANGLDAETQYNAKFSSKYDNTTKTLILANQGVALERQTLLFGGTDKSNDRRLIGQYGEGMKLAFLALTREGHSVVVRNGRFETWKPRIQNSKDFGGEPVLALEITTAKRQKDNFEVEISDIEFEVWEEVEKMFLRLNPGQNISTDCGEILLDALHVGKIFVRGVYVCVLPKSRYGYNVWDLDIGRDRQIPASWQLNPIISSMHKQAQKEGKTPRKVLYDMIDADSPESEAFRYYGDKGLVSELVQEFLARYGNNAYPATSTGDALSLEFVGRKAVVVGKVLCGLLLQEFPQLDDLKKAKERAILRRYLPSEISPEEMTVFKAALRDFSVVFKTESWIGRVSVADFGSELILGLHSGADILISRKVLRSYGSAMVTLAHELSHDFGDDGTAQHFHSEEEVLEEILNLHYRRAI